MSPHNYFNINKLYIMEIEIWIVHPERSRRVKPLKTNLQNPAPKTGGDPEELAGMTKMNLSKSRLSLRSLRSLRFITLQMRGRNA